jgi:hypothetical protein
MFRSIIAGITSVIARQAIDEVSNRRLRFEELEEYYFATSSSMSSTSTSYTEKKVEEEFFKKEEFDI